VPSFVSFILVPEFAVLFSGLGPLLEFAFFVADEAIY